MRASHRGIDERVQDVGQDVGEEHHDRDEREDRHPDREVALRRGLPRQEAHAVEAEQELDEDAPGDERREAPR